jgi:hypothetical protein
MMNHLAHSDDGQISARAFDIGFAERDGIRLFWDRPLHGTECDILEENHQIVVTNRGDE